MKNENENRRDHSGIKRRGGKAMADQSEVGCGRTREKRRSDLLRVLMVCEANIFGEEEPGGICLCNNVPNVALVVVCVRPRLS